ncbi:hypothetical protein THAOC_13564 [Thalassiosira oceanica]|uniref:Uncharacterized protein n=1 Tax=Thalassiosira oceanica TaxID=159749 RepID=K0SX41_THAOC|nr:hypothetical protein THAOC_13564 [Thalassiosira oceanica]|eukprot:EJK65556.1 hypothetical protein THAOC_13564 [Thalassiosira oceanica]
MAEGTEDEAPAMLTQCSSGGIWRHALGAQSGRADVAKLSAENADNRREIAPEPGGFRMDEDGAGQGGRVGRFGDRPPPRTGRLRGRRGRESRRIGAEERTIARRTDAEEGKGLRTSQTDAEWDSARGFDGAWKMDTVAALAGRATAVGMALLGGVSTPPVVCSFAAEEGFLGLDGARRELSTRPRGVPVPEVRAGRLTAVGSETVETHSPLLVHGLADLRSLPPGGGGERRASSSADGSPIHFVVRAGVWGVADESEGRRREVGAALDTVPPCRPAEHYINGSNRSGARRRLERTDGARALADALGMATSDLRIRAFTTTRRGCAYFGRG